MKNLSDPKFIFFAEKMYKPLSMNNSMAMRSYAPNFNIVVGMSAQNHLEEFLSYKDSASKEAIQFVTFFYDEFVEMNIGDKPFSDVEISMSGGFSSIGWNISVPEKETYLKISTCNREQERVKIIAGVNARRSTSDLENVLYLESLPKLETVKYLNVSDRIKQDLVEFNANVIEILGYNGSPLNKPKIDDFGCRAFEEIDGQWKHIERFDSGDVSCNGKDFYLDNTKKIVVVPYMFDIEELYCNEEKTLTEQSKLLPDLMKANLEKLKSDLLDKDTITIMSKCYTQLRI
jgi:hypothetical protein